MADWILFGSLGLAAGAVYAAIAIGVILVHRGSAVVNLAQGAMAMFPAVVFVSLRTEGVLVLPVVGIPGSFDLGDPWPVLPAMAVALVIGVLIGLLAYLLVFRLLADAAPVSRLVASVGLTIVLQGVAVAQVGTATRRAPAVLPDGLVTFDDRPLPTDRFWLVAVIVGIGMIVAALYRYTSFGLATRGAAENPKGAVLMGFSPVRLGSLNWMLGAAVASVAGVLISPISGVNPFNYSLFVVPALAAALAGRLRSFGVAMATALAIGAFEGLTVHLVSREQVPTLLLGGFDSLVPFVVIVGMLVLAGRTIPDRGTTFDRRQPVVPVPGRHPVRRVALVGLAVAAMALGDSALRLSAITSMFVTILCLSIVLLTGYVGQVSLAQLTLAGFSAFMLATASDRWGLPFPVAPAVAVAFATALGLAISLPALRIRGMQFAIVTLAAAVAIEQLLFRSPVFTGPGGTAVVRPPSIAGVEFGILGEREYPDVWFGLLALGITLLSIGVVTSVRRSGLGRRMLAVRANERAASAAGIDLARTKLAAAGIASAVAGLAGVVFAYKNVQFGWAGLESARGLQILALAFLGGVGSVGGAVIAGLIAPSGVILVALGSPSASGTQLVVTGVGLLVVTIAFPAGIAGAGPWVRRMVTRVADASRSSRPSVPDDLSTVEVFVVDVGEARSAGSRR